MKCSRKAAGFHLAMMPLHHAAVVVLFLPYLALNLAVPAPPILYPLGGAIALLAALLLAWRRADRERMNLRIRYPSLRGLITIAPLAVAVLVAAAMDRIHWPDAGEALSGLGSGVAQELYFRGALLAVLTTSLGRRRGLLAQTVLFAGWHVRAFLAVDVPLATTIVLGSLGAGFLLGKQVMRDRTLIWAALVHSAFLVMQ